MNGKNQNLDYFPQHLVDHEQRQSEIDSTYNDGERNG
jgi:hypothetical protein